MSLQTASPDLLPLPAAQAQPTVFPLHELTVFTSLAPHELLLMRRDPCQVSDKPLAKNLPSAHQASRFKVPTTDKPTNSLQGQHNQNKKQNKTNKTWFEWIDGWCNLVA
jgi:hypothetical protein